MLSPLLDSSGNAGGGLDVKLYARVSEVPALRARLRARISQLDEVIAPAIAADLGAPVDDQRAQLADAALVAALNLLADQGAAKDRAWTPEEAQARIDPVFTFLRAGLDALANPG